MKPAKCCAFQPFVPNFLLGAWLRDAVEVPVIANVYFTPAGAIALPSYRARHAEVADPGTDLLCGFFNRETRACGLWSFRPGECSTFYCDDLQTGEPRQALRQKTFDVELAVTQMALVELGFSPREIGEQIDLVNGAESNKIYPGPDLLIMYKKAWNWCQTLKPQTVMAWIPEKT